MNIAEQKRQNNIAEYIIHIYQTEDLIRAFDFDMEQIKQYVLKHITHEGVDQEELTYWYADLLSQMKKEGIEKEGHLNFAQTYVEELIVLKSKLIESDDDFTSKYDKAKPHIEEMLKLSQGKVKSDIQLCLNAVYGLLLTRIQGREVPEEMKESLELFGDVLSYLSYKYKQENFLNENWALNPKNDTMYNVFIG